ncbi:hypothetical protein [Desulfovibrio sp. Huiquan2017]|uniref:hypothetical protein n=1 Tax=Desulfovibrio sp. Huiquan2017 TaxID=2816861 RepID=UPI001A929A83|nr:hypothetical protein [Desulfovibrio sp. Huiquan2017]
MTIASTESKVLYGGNGSTASFAIPFMFLRNEDIRVLLVDTEDEEWVQSEGTDYRLSGVGEQNGGACTMSLPPEPGQTLVIRREPAMVQEVDYVENDAFPAASHEAALDKLTMICQALSEKLDRALTFRISSALTGVNLPEPDPGRVLAWNSGGDDLINKDIVALGSMITPVPISQGGTDADNPTEALFNLGFGAVGLTVAGCEEEAEALAAIGAEPADADIVKAPGGVLPLLDGSNLTGLDMSPLLVAPQTVMVAPTGSKIANWADGDQDAPVLSLRTASDLKDTYYSAERVDAVLAAGAVGIAPGIVVAYAWGGTVYASEASPDGLSVDLSGSADGWYHLYADLNEDGSWAGVGYSAPYPAYGTARLTPGSDLYNTATGRMYDGTDTEVRRVYIGRVKVASGVPIEIVETPIGTSVTLPVASGAIIEKSTTYVEPNPFSGPASVELELYGRTRASASDIRWQRVDSIVVLSSNGRGYGSAPTCVSADDVVVTTANWAAAPIQIYFDGLGNCPGRIKLTRGF